MGLRYGTLDLPTDAPLEHVILSLTHSRYFEAWSCAFCERPETSCPCRRQETNAGNTPLTKDEFKAFLRAECREAVMLQKAYKGYLEKLLTHIPFTTRFNDEQEVKVTTAVDQLDGLRSRIRDLLHAAEFLVSDAERCVPAQFQEACDEVRAWLALQHGNMVACHVCFKINYTLASPKSK